MRYAEETDFNWWLHWWASSNYIIVSMSTLSQCVRLFSMPKTVAPIQETQLYPSRLKQISTGVNRDLKRYSKEVRTDSLQHCFDYAPCVSVFLCFVYLVESGLLYYITLKPVSLLKRLNSKNVNPEVRLCKHIALISFNSTRRHTGHFYPAGPNNFVKETNTVTYIVDMFRQRTQRRYSIGRPWEWYVFLHVS